MTANTLPQTGFIRLPVSLSDIPISLSTWWAWVKTGKAPAGRKLGPRITAWKAEDIRNLIASHGN